MKQKLVRYLLYPVFVFLCVFVAVAIVMILKQDPTKLLAWIFIITVNITALYVVSYRANPSSLKQALLYGVVWAAILIFLDFAITSLLIGFVGYKTYVLTPKTLFSYAIIIFIPVDWATRLAIGRLINKNSYRSR